LSYNENAVDTAASTGLVSCITSDLYLGVVICSNHETFNRLILDQSIHNLRDICYRDVPVRKVIGFDQNRHAGRALIETTRCADARLELGESPRGNLLFQRSVHFFRVLGRAASFRVVLSPTIDADKKIALALQSGESRTRGAARQRPKNSNCVLAITDDTYRLGCDFPETRSGSHSGSEFNSVSLIVIVS
jgi:hypothetical protein